MKHYSHPIHKKELERKDISKYSSQCVDELHIQFEWNGDILKTAKWDGIGCAVFQSSSDIFIGLMIGKTKKMIKNLVDNYENLINQNGKEYNKELLGELMIYQNVKAQLNRLNCANMISQAIIKNSI